MRAPGAQCAHNLNYWSFGDYLGIGAGAHGKITDAERRRDRAHAADCASRGAIWRRNRARCPESRSVPATCRSNSP